MNQASMHVAEDRTDITVDIRKLIGDKSGFMHIHSDQVFIVEYVQALQNSFTAGKYRVSGV